MGIAGNVLVLVVIVSQAHMQTTTNMYILNMAAADILMCLGKEILQEIQTYENVYGQNYVIVADILGYDVHQRHYLLDQK